MILKNKTRFVQSKRNKSKTIYLEEFGDFSGRNNKYKFETRVRPTRIVKREIAFVNETHFD